MNDKNLDCILDSGTKKGGIEGIVGDIGRFISGGTSSLYNKLTAKETWKSVGKYLFDKKRLKSVGVLGGTIAAVAIFKDKMPAIEEYFRHTFPWLSNEAVSFAVDTLTYTVCAPLGFLMSNYANNKKVSKKEIIGQIAYSGAWSIFRHYVYSGLSNFDEVTPMNVSVKGGLYAAYYALAVGAYALFSDLWRKTSNGVDSITALKEIPNSLKKLKNLVTDPNLQYNMVLNLANIYNPWVKIRPTLAAALTIDQNMNVIKHSHERRHGFLSYLKEVFSNNSYKNNQTLR